MHRHSWLFNFCFWSALALCSQAAFSAEDKGKKDPKVEDKPAAVADDKLKWGNLSATFIYDGEPPEPRELKIDKDREFYKDPIFDASLLVDEKSKGIANVVTWLYVPNGEKPPPIHASYSERAKQDVVLDTV